MKRLPNGEYDRDVLHAVKLIKNYDKLLREALKMGFCYNDDICSVLHNERAFWMNKLEQDSDDELICQIWKNGTVHVYDRAEYLTHTQGKEVGRKWKEHHEWDKYKKEMERRKKLYEEYKVSENKNDL